VHLVGGAGVFVRRTDGPEGAPHVWYVHGLEGASGNWDRLAAALSGISTGFAPDLPGSGRSDPPRRG
jgi:pimeloyl-ACP methyl ester carboxylesterase